LDDKRCLRTSINTQTAAAKTSVAASGYSPASEQAPLSAPCHFVPAPSQTNLASTAILGLMDKAGNAARHLAGPLTA
jgi:hypothetical protein